MTPSLVIELESMGYKSLEDLKAVGWQKLCEHYLKSKSSKATADFFVLLYAIVNNVEIRKVTKEKQKNIEKFLKKAKASSEAGFAKKSKK